MICRFLLLMMVTQVAVTVISDRSEMVRVQSLRNIVNYARLVRIFMLVVSPGMLLFFFLICLWEDSYISLVDIALLILLAGLLALAYQAAMLVTAILLYSVLRRLFLEYQVVKEAELKEQVMSEIRRKWSVHKLLCRSGCVELEEFLRAVLVEEQPDGTGGKRQTDLDLDGIEKPRN